MIIGALTRRAEELTAQGAPFVTATVVRVQHPTSVEPGNAALVRSDGSIEGFVGGVCAQHSVRLYSLQAMRSGEPVLLRIIPDGEPDPDAVEDPEASEEVERDEGSVTVRNPCLSGGAIEIFLEPVLPPPRVVVAGDSPIADALRSLGAAVGLEMVSATDPATPSSNDLALVVAAHGKDETLSLRTGLQVGVRYVGLVASQKRGAGVLADLRADGVPEELIAAVDTPAGLEIGARTPTEIALAILARIVAVRRAAGACATAAPVDTPPTAVDPICGMTVVVVADTPALQHDEEMVYFCGEGCKRAFEQQHEHAITAG